MTAAVRLRLLLAEDRPTIQGYDQDEFARRLHYDRPHEASLELFRCARESTAEILERLTPADWLREGDAHRGRPLRRRNLAEDLRRARAQARAPDPRRRGTRRRSSEYGGTDRRPSSQRHGTAGTARAGAGTPPRPTPTIAISASTSPPRVERRRAAGPIRTGCRSAACRARTRRAARARRSAPDPARRNSAISSTAARTGRKRAAIGHVDLAAAAGLLRVLLERRLEERPAGSARPAARARSSRPRAARRRSTARRSARTAASCRALPTASCPRRAPRPDRRSRVSSVGMFGDGMHPRQAGLVEVHRAPPAVHRHDVERAADAELVVEQPRQLADRHAVAQRNRELPDERASTGSRSSVAFDVLAADRVRPVADDDAHAVARRGAHAVRHRVDVGVDARADVLQIDDQRRRRRASISAVGSRVSL